jgi:hypothetical protein
MWRSAATIGNYLRNGWEEIAAKPPKRPASEHHLQARLVITRPCIIIKPTTIMILASTKWGMSTLTRVKMHAERLEPAKHRKADAAGGHRAGVHALDVIGARDVLGDVPATLDYPQLPRCRRFADRARVGVSYETVRRSVLKFGPLFAKELRRRRHRQF